MDIGIDTGDILNKKEFAIPEDMNSGELFDILSQLGADLLLETIDDLKNNRLCPTKQDESKSSYASMLSKELCPIDFSKSAAAVHNHIRGLYPWPVATTKINGKTFKIHKSRNVTENFNGKPGEIVDNNNRLICMCGDGCCVEILEIQAEGKRRMDSASFLRGYKIEKGTVMGE